MKILSSKVLARAESPFGVVRRCWLALHAVLFANNGKEHTYFMVTRGDQIVPHAQKQPDAVCAIGFYYGGSEPQIVLTKEYRIPIGGYEIGSVAGLIDVGDYDIPDHIGMIASPQAAAVKAAIREFKEETGLEFFPQETSAANLYSSAGLTNESVCIVIGKASGTINSTGQEENEDIHTMILNRREVCDLLGQKELAFSKHVWPFLWMIKHYGFPSI